MKLTFIDPDELAGRLHYKRETIMRTKLDTVLIESIHYIRPFGGKKVLFIWENIERDLLAGALSNATIPMANGGFCHG